MSTSAAVLAKDAHLNQIIQNLRSFLYLADQAPLETVCKSALFLLDKIPSSRHAVFEYISTLYKVFTLYHLRFNQTLRIQPDSSIESSDMNHINQALDLIENSLGCMIQKSNEWRIELIAWLANLLGDICSSTGPKFAESTDLQLTQDEMQRFRAPTIADGLDIWSNQCKPTQSLISLIQKCMQNSSKFSRQHLIDLILDSSVKYHAHFDWILVYFTSMNAELILSKVLWHNFKNASSLLRLNVLNFYALNFSQLTLNEIRHFLIVDEENYSIEDKCNFVLKICTHAQPCLNLLLNELISNSSDLCRYFNQHLTRCDAELLFNCLRQINNSNCVYELCNSIFEWLIYLNFDCSQKQHTNESEYFRLAHLINTFLDELVASVYLIKENLDDHSTVLNASDSVPFLKSLSLINSYSMQNLIKKPIDLCRSCAQSSLFPNEIVYKFLVLLSINNNESVAKSIVSHLFTMNSNEILAKFRQEIEPFHADCFKNSISSLSKSFCDNESDRQEDRILNFVQNLVMLLEWDQQNPNFMSENLANIVVEQQQIFTDLISLLSTKNEICSLAILKLLNKILESNQEDALVLKLNMNNLTVCSQKFIHYFFELCGIINEENALEVIDHLTELFDLIRHSLVHASAIDSDETSPCRNLLLRNLVDKVFETILSSKKIVKKQEAESGFLIDENENLFTSNTNLINSELMHKSKLKTLRNNLANHGSFTKRQNVANLNLEMKSIRNYAVLDLLDIIATRYNFIDEKAKTNQHSPSKQNFKIKKHVIGEQVDNLADCLVQKVLLDQHYIDYRWPSVTFADVDENFEAELDAIKLFIERDMNVQKYFDNECDNQILWMLLEYVVQSENAFYKAAPLIRCLLGSLIVQWESYHEQPTRNAMKSLCLTIRLLNLINMANCLQKPFCYIVDIVPLINSYEAHILLLLIWRNLKRKCYQHMKTKSPMGNRSSNDAILPPNLLIGNKNEIKHLRYVFQRNVNKLAPLYAKFFSN